MTSTLDSSTRQNPEILLPAVLALSLLAGCDKKVQVPDVKGLTTDKARQVLSSRQLKAGKVTCNREEVLASAKILSQSPNAGERVALNSAIDMVVEDSSAVPKLLDMGAADALLNTGLKASLNKKTEFLHWGTVIEQDVAPGTMVSPATVATLTVAAPPDMTMFQDMITKQPAYQKLSQKERDLVDQLYK